MTPAAAGGVQFGQNNAVVQLKTTREHRIPTAGAAGPPLRSGRKRAAAASEGSSLGSGRHVQARNAGGPSAKKNILAALPPCRRWAGQPLRFPPRRWVSGRTGTRVALGAGRLPAYTRLTARSAAAVRRVADVALAGGTGAYPGAWRTPRVGCGLPSGLAASLAVAPEAGRGGGFVAGRDIPTGLLWHPLTGGAQHVF